MHSLVDLLGLHHVQKLSNMSRKESCWAKQSLEERLIFVLNVKKLRIMEGEVFGIPLSARVERPDFKRTPSAWRWRRSEKRQGLWTELLPLLQHPITGDERCSRWRTCSTEESLGILYWKREAQDNKLIRRVDFYTVTENVTEYVIRGEDSDHGPVMAWGGDQWPPFNSNGFERAVENIQTVGLHVTQTDEKRTFAEVKTKLWIKENVVCVQQSQRTTLRRQDCNLTQCTIHSGFQAGTDLCGAGWQLQWPSAEVMQRITLDFHRVHLSVVMGPIQVTVPVSTGCNGARCNNPAQGSAWGTGSRERRNRKYSALCYIVASFSIRPDTSSEKRPEDEQADGRIWWKPRVRGANCLN